MAAAFRFEVLRAEHDRTAFSSGVEPLDRYFREQATQDIRRRVSACYVVIDVATSTIAGYYTLAAGGVPLIDRNKQKISRFMTCELKRRIFGPLFDFILLGPVHHSCGNFAEEALRFQEFLISFQHFQKT